MTDRITPPLGINTVSAAKKCEFSESIGERIRFNPSTGEILEDPAINSRRIRYALQHSAQTILCSKKSDNGKPHRIGLCCKMANGDYVKVLKDKSRSGAFYGSVMTCSSVWACPLCGAIISERRANEVREACSIARGMGYKISMVTLTVRHGIEDEISNLIDGITKAFSLLTSHRSFKEWRLAHGVLGFIKATEVTRSDLNGWHPHFHILVISKHSLNKSALITSPKTGKQKLVSIPELWQTCCEKKDLPIPDLIHGLDIKEEKTEIEQNHDDSLISDYISKATNDTKLNSELFDNKDKKKWDFADEISKWHSKKGREQSLTPFDFLRLVDSQIDAKNKDRAILAKYSHLFRDYVKAMYRKSQMYWSTDLRKLLGMDEELTDEEVLEEKEAQADLLAMLYRDEWKKIVLARRRSDLLTVAETEGFQGLAKFVFKYCYGESDNYEEFYARFSAQLEYGNKTQNNIDSLEEFENNISSMIPYEMTKEELYIEAQTEYYNDRYEGRAIRSTNS